MKKLLMSFFVIAAFNCAAVSATASANFFSKNDQTLGFNGPVLNLQILIIESLFLAIARPSNITSLKS